MAMHEILFRAQRTDNKEWVEGYYVIVGKGTQYEQHIICVDAFEDRVSDHYIYPFHLHQHRVDPATVGQFVEKRDKRGHKVFDGDFLKDNLGNIFLVDYCEDWAAFRARLVWGKGEDGKFTRFLAGSRSFIGTNWEGLEVVGNLWDMPDLIEREEGKDG
jgi:hypothetical protein